jgi:uncharacterized protein
MDKQAVVEATRHWIESMVIGLDLCPFARSVYETDRIRYVVTEATDEEQLLEDLTVELRSLASAAPTQIETTLLIHPHVLGSFLDFNDFLGVSDQVIAHLGLRGVIQLASFHPEYQFSGTKPDDVENYTNRSPYPILHLLREDSITRAASGFIDLALIPPRNIDTLKRLGKQKILERYAQ